MHGSTPVVNKVANMAVVALLEREKGNHAEDQQDAVQRKHKGRNAAFSRQCDT